MKSELSQELYSACLLCRNTGLKRLGRYESTGLVRCPRCQFIFSSFIPSEKALIDHYDSYPRNRTISPITLKRYDELSDELKKYAKEDNWLDVGCGSGDLLHQVQKSGWNVFGTEFTDTAVRICMEKGISMHKGPLSTSDYKPDFFDVVTSIEVLEHINNPHEEIEKFRYILRPGGVLYITTPNFNSLSRLLLKERWHIITYPEHLCYYTTYTLDKLLTEHGFKKVYITTNGFDPSGFLKHLRRSLSRRSNPKPANNDDLETIRRITEHNKFGSAVKKYINRMLNFTKTGDTLKALYIKS